MSPPVPDPLPADCARGYRLVRELGRGGYGRVFLAEQTALERQVAIKVLDAAAVDEPGQRERFEAEARLTASIAHPHVVRLLDYGAATGIPWIAYEFMPGASLRELLAAGPLAPADALRAAAQVADALAAAHAAGVIHRDVKPENVLREGTACKLIDFGIAKFGGATVKTASGMILGTPAYIAPEVVTGAPPGASSDLYALGVMLFELLTGRAPFLGEPLGELLRQQVQEVAPPPSAFASGIEVGVDRLLARMLAKSPRERPASASAARSELAALADAAQAAAGEEHPGGGPVRSAPDGGIAGESHSGVTARGSGIRARPPRTVATALPAAPARPGIALRAVGLFALLGAVGLLALRGGKPPPPPPTAIARASATPAPPAPQVDLELAVQRLKTIDGDRKPWNDRYGLIMATGPLSAPREECIAVAAGMRGIAHRYAELGDEFRRAYGDPSRAPFGPQGIWVAAACQAAKAHLQSNSAEQYNDAPTTAALLANPELVPSLSLYFDLVPHVIVALAAQSTGSDLGLVFLLERMHDLAHAIGFLSSRQVRNRGLGKVVSDFAQRLRQLQPERAHAMGRFAADVWTLEIDAPRTRERQARLEELRADVERIAAPHDAAKRYAESLR